MTVNNFYILISQKMTPEIQNEAISNQLAASMNENDKNILIVEDSPTMRRIIFNTLKQIGFLNVISAGNGAEAIKMLGSNPIGFIITDWNMPEMNGLEFVTWVRNNDKYKDLPILMITTRGMKEHVIEAVKAGVNNYIVKPFTTELLQQKIEKLMI